MRSLALLSTLGILAATSAAFAAPQSYGSRQTPLALAPEYGDIALTAPGTGTGAVVVSTREGIEVRLATSPGGAAVGRYRAPGVVEGLAVSGSSAYLFLGSGGIATLDISNPALPVASGSTLAPGAVRMGAVLSDGSCAAASDSFVYVFRRESGGELTYLETLGVPAGYFVRRVRAHGDSILVVAARPGGLARLRVAVYRLPAGAGGVTLLHEWFSNGKGANDAVWLPPIAFIADGNTGIHALNTETGVFVAPILMLSGSYVRAIDATGSDLFAAGEAGNFQRFSRIGALGDTLAPHAGETLQLDSYAVAADGGRAYVTTRDDYTPVDPNEVGESQIEFPLSSASPVTPIAPVMSLGRSRRVVVNAGLAYVADYSGGLRIYRAGDSDTTLVGALPPLPSGDPVDLALDPAQHLVYLASGSVGLEVVDVADPSAPARLGSLAMPGGASASAVTLAGPSLVAVASNNGPNGNVTFVNVGTPATPIARGSVLPGTVVDPRGLAAIDTVLFVADHLQGVLQVGFGNPDAPAGFNIPSTAGARDLDLQGTTLLVATRSRGVQVIDVFNPAIPILRSEVPLPPVLGVTRNGGMAVAALGSGGVALLDVSNPSSARLQGMVPASGFPRDAAWVGDTLLVAGGTSIDRFLLAPSLPVTGSLGISVDAGAALPRATISWSIAAAAGQIGWNVYHASGPVTSGSQSPAGRRVNSSLLPTTITSAIDNGLVPGVENRYRLEAVFDAGALRTVATGSVYAPSTSMLGRPFPNPFRGSDGVTVPYQAMTPGDPGAVILMRIYDVRGRRIREVEWPAPTTPGYGSVTWDGKDGSGRRVSAGVYYLYVRGPGIDDARSVVYLP